MTAASLALLVAVDAAFTGLDGIGRGTALRAAPGTAGPDRGAVLAATGPQLLLGHVWLVAAAGLLVGLFPRWEAAVVSQAYWWVLAIAAGLVLRVAALGVAALGVPAPGARTGSGPGPVRAALAAAGALASGAGTGGFLAAAAGVWPVVGAAAVVALDLVLAGWSLGVGSDRGDDGGRRGLLLVPAAVLAAGGAITGAAVVVALVAAGVLFGRRRPGARRDQSDPGRGGAGRGALAGTGRARRGNRPGRRAGHGPGRRRAGTGVAAPTFVLVLAVQVWFWRGPPAPGALRAPGALSVHGRRPPPVPAVVCTCWSGSPCWRPSRRWPRRRRSPVPCSTRPRPRSACWPP